MGSRAGGWAAIRQEGAFRVGVAELQIMRLKFGALGIEYRSRPRPTCLAHRSLGKEQLEIGFPRRRGMQG